MHNSHLLITPTTDSSEYIHLTPQRAGWDLLHFSARRLAQGETFEWDTGENELALAVFGGSGSVQSSRGLWDHLGRRPDVFSGMPYALYLPRCTRFTVKAESALLDFGCGWCATNQDHPARLIRPADVEIEIRGGDNVTRQINKMIPPGFDCHHLVMVEVYTPSGNWSSYPPHKHDQHVMDEQGKLVEADLEEIYFYKIDKPEGFAYQRVYTGDGRIDELMLVRNDHLVISPEGYHPVVSAPGYTTYYLNILAGSAQSLAAQDDPAYAWVKNTYRGIDPRLPLVTHEMEG